MLITVTHDDQSSAQHTDMALYCNILKDILTVMLTQCKSKSYLAGCVVSELCTTVTNCYN